MSNYTGIPEEDKTILGSGSRLYSVNYRDGRLRPI
jgi:hypothetical protein